MRLTFFFSFLFLFIASVNADTIEVSGDVSGTWDTDTVLVIDNINIPSGQTLKINPGVQVIFNAYYLFKVTGQIVANGSEYDSISFSISDTTGFYNLETNKGAWAGFWFEPIETNTDSSSFEFCQFNYGKAVSIDSNYWHGGAAAIWKYNYLRFSNCTFANNIAYKNGGAIYCKSSNILIEQCEFDNNKGGTPDVYGYGGGVCLEYSNAKVYHNYFIKNTSTGVGGGLSFEYSNPDIKANIFYQNFSAIGGGLCGLRSEKGNSIANNLFQDNGSTFFGGGVAFLEAHSLFTNNTVVDNISMYGGGLYTNAGAKPVIKNSIIWYNRMTSENGPQVYIYDVYSAPEFYYNNIEGGFEDFSGSGIGNFLGVYENNIDSDPQFDDANSKPYSLREGSPCINSGSPDTLGLFLPYEDLAGNIRLMEDSLDMGCYESQGNSSIMHFALDNTDLYVSPNPITNNASFQFNSSKLSVDSKLIIYNSNGIQVKSFDIKNRTTINWDGRNDLGEKLPSGIYLYQISNNNSSYTKKLIIKR